MKPSFPCRRPAVSRRAYNLVVLTVAVTLLSVWVAASTPLWSHQIRRDKEAELIFRGLQYAEAIRVFQTRYSRYPTSLKELIEVEPRCIRRLWENPMREDGRWGLVPVGVRPGAPGQPGQPQDLGGNAGNNRGGGESAGFGDDGELGPDGRPKDAGVILSADTDDLFGGPPSTVPIRGVYAAVSEESVRRFLGKENLNEWRFTVELFATMKQGDPSNPSLVTPFTVAEIQGNWPEGVVPQTPQPSSEPQQQPNQNQNPNQNPGDPRARPDLRGPGAPGTQNPAQNPNQNPGGPRPMPEGGRG